MVDIGFLGIEVVEDKYQPAGRVYKSVNGTKLFVSSDVYDRIWLSAHFPSWYRIAYEEEPPITREPSW